MNEFIAVVAEQNSSQSLSSVQHAKIYMDSAATNSIRVQP